MNQIGTKNKMSSDSTRIAVRNKANELQIALPNLNNVYPTQAYLYRLRFHP